MPVRASSLIRERPYRARQESSLALERHHKFRCGDDGGKFTVETGATGTGNIRCADDAAWVVLASRDYEEDDYIVGRERFLEASQ